MAKIYENMSLIALVPGWSKFEKNSKRVFFLNLISLSFFCQSFDVCLNPFVHPTFSQTTPTRVNPIK